MFERLIHLLQPSLKFYPLVASILGGYKVCIVFVDHTLIIGSAFLSFLCRRPVGRVPLTFKPESFEHFVRLCIPHGVFEGIYLLFFWLFIQLRAYAKTFKICKPFFPLFRFEAECWWLCELCHIEY